MFETVLLKNSAQHLAVLGEKKILDFAYMAGGTACALQLGHRISLDFDFFTKQKFKVPDVQTRLDRLKNFRLEETSPGTIIGTIGEIKFSLFYYQYPLIKKIQKFKNINIASLEDIAAMKLSAITGRATRKDYIDIYFLLEKFSIAKMMEFYEKKYKKLAINKIHILKSLQYFDDVDDKIPEMLKLCSWAQVKKVLTEESGKIKF